MTSEERVKALHSKMLMRRRMQGWRKTGAIGAVGIILTASLLLLILNHGMVNCLGTSEMYAGTTMLFEDAGGSVLRRFVGKNTMESLQEESQRYESSNSSTLFHSIYRLLAIDRFR